MCTPHGSIVVGAMLGPSLLSSAASRHACREPQFSNADRSCLWELTSLAAHVHPSGERASKRGGEVAAMGCSRRQH